MAAKEKETGNGVLAVVSDRQPDSIEEMRLSVVGLTTEALKSELARLLGFTAENILRLAIVVNEIETRGEDLSALRFGLLPILRLIASGSLLPDVVVLFAGQPQLIKEIGMKPIDEQKQIVQQGHYQSALPEPKRINGKPSHQSVSDDDEKDQDADYENTGRKARHGYQTKDFHVGGNLTEALDSAIILLPLNRNMLDARMVAKIRELAAVIDNLPFWKND